MLKQGGQWQGSVDVGVGVGVARDARDAAVALPPHAHAVAAAVTRENEGTALPHWIMTNIMMVRA
jgi:hypothetical protein